MSSWDFRKEGTANTAGTDPALSLKVGYQPFSEADTLASKRNVIATEKGWVRRTNGTGGRAGRQIDEVLVAAHPGVAGGYAGANYLGFPDIAQIYLGDETGSGGYANNVAMNLYVVFNEPVKFSTGTSSLTLEATKGANTITFEANNALGITNANNTLVFEGTLGIDDSGVYTIGAQTITVASGGLVSLNAGGESANLVITAAAANTISGSTITFV